MSEWVQARQSSTGRMVRVRIFSHTERNKLHDAADHLAGCASRAGNLDLYMRLINAMYDMLEVRLGRAADPSFPTTWGPPTYVVPAAVLARYASPDRTAYALLDTEWEQLDALMHEGSYACARAWAQRDGWQLFISPTVAMANRAWKIARGWVAR